MRAPMLGERLDGLGSLVEVVNEGNVEGRLPQQLPALVRVCAQHTDDHGRHSVLCPLGGDKCSTRDHVAAENAPEYVDEYFGDVPVGQDYPQRLGYLSSSAPPPTSRKLAGAVPAAKVTSIVAIARPAPLTMHPTSPSSLT